MSTTYSVDLLFKAPNTDALTKMQRQIESLERALAKTGKGTEDIFDGTEKGARKATTAVQGLLGALGPLLAAYASFRTVQSIFTAGAEIETQTRSIKVLTGSLESARDIIKQLQDYGAVTPFTSSELIDTARRLKAFGVETTKIVDVTKRLGDVAGATGADLNGIATAYGQVVAKGRLQGEELLQFQERGVAVGEELRKMYGDQFPKALERGLIPAKAVEVALARLTSQGGQYFGGAIAQADTLTGKLSTLQDSFQRLAQNIGTALAPVFKWVIDSLNTILEKINDTLFNGGRLRQREIQAQEQANREAQQRYGRFATIPGRATRDEALAFAEKRRKEILAQKRAELGGPPKAAASAPPDLTTPALLTSGADDTTAKRLADLQKDTIQRLNELEKDADKEAADLRRDYLKEYNDARKDAIKEIGRMEKELAREQLDATRKLEDARADLTLQRNIGGLSGTEDEQAVQRRYLEAFAGFRQRERDRQRTFEDKQRELATKLEDFKVKTAETIGRINLKFQETWGKNQLRYAETAGKIIETAARNAGEIQLEYATKAAQITQGAAGGGGGGAAGGSINNQGNANVKLIADTLTKKLNLSPVAIAGVLGNLDYESAGLKNPNIVEGGGFGALQAGRGYGFAQWTAPDRQAALRQRAGGSGLPNAQVQAEFLVEELTKKFPDALKALRNSRTVEEATKAFQDLFLMPFKPTQNTAERIRRAQGYLGAGSTPGPAAGGGVVARTGSTGIGTGPHLDVRWGDGRPITKADADKYMILNGKPPSAYGVTSGYGPRVSPTAGASSFHRGIDFGTPEGTPISLKGGATAGRSFFDPNGGGQVLEINTPQGTMKLLHLGKGSTVSGITAGAAGVAGGTAAAVPDYKASLKPYPKMPGLLGVPDLTAELAPVNASMAALLNTSKELRDTLSEADLAKLFNDLSAPINDITADLDRQIKQGKDLAEQDKLRLEYMRDGYAPAMAEQLSLIDAQSAAMQEKLNYEIASLETELAKLDATDKLYETTLKLLNLAKERRDEIPERVAQLRNQAVEADAAKKNPQNILTQGIAERQEQLDALLNPANQLITAADAIGGAFGQAFQDIASGSMNAGEAMSAMFKKIGAAFLDMAAQMLAQQAALGILKLFGGALMGGGGGTGFAETGGLFNSGIGAGFGGYMGGAFAKGGYPPVGKLSVVGEEGPELFVPGMRGTILPNDVFAATREALINKGDLSAGDAPTAAEATAEARAAVERSSRVSIQTALNQTREALSTSSTTLRERVVEVERAAAANATMEPISVSIDAFDPAKAGLTTIDQTRAIAQTVSAQTQAQMLQRMRRDPGFRRSNGM